LRFLNCGAFISSDAILVDKAVVPKDGAVDIISGSEIVPGPEEQG